MICDKMYAKAQSVLRGGEPVSSKDLSHMNRYILRNLYSSFCDSS